MQFPKTCKLHLIAKKDPSRYAMTHIRHEPGKLIATDGKRLAIVNVTDDDGEPEALIPAHIVKAAVLKSPTPEARLIVNGDAQALTKEGKITAPLGDGEFPKIEQVIPQVNSASKVTVGLNAKLLHELAQALGKSGKQGEEIYLEFDREEFEKGQYRAPVKFETENGIGVIMPCTK